MALPGRPAPLSPLRFAAGAVAPLLTPDDVNRLITDLNAQLDAVWDALQALDARLAAGL